MMGKVLGFTGAIASGKTTAAGLLRQTANISAAHVEFSGPVLDIARAWMGKISVAADAGAANLGLLQHAVDELYGLTITDAQLSTLSVEGLEAYLETRKDIRLPEREITIDTKNVHRPLLQWLGYEMVTHVDARFWSQIVSSEIEMHTQNGAKLITVGGVRFPGDADMIHDISGRIVKVVNPNNNTAIHSLEGGIPSSHIDLTVINDGGIAELTGKMANLWHDLANDQLVSSY